jgi:hypothetical protein
LIVDRTGGGVVDLRFRWLGQKGHSEGEVVLVRVFLWRHVPLFSVGILLDTFLFAALLLLPIVDFFHKQEEE